MSIDVTYYSFSPKRADEGWAEKGEASIKGMSRNSFLSVSSEEFEEVGRAVGALFFSRYKSLREKILSRLSKPPSEYGIDSSTPLIEFIKYGNEDDQDEYWILNREHSGAAMEARQTLSRERYSKGQVEGVEYEDLIHELIELDLKYGAIAAWFEYPELEDPLQRLFSEKLGIPAVDDVLDKEGWLHFIQRSKEQRERLNEVINSLAEEMDFSKEEAESMLVDYLGSIRDILNDLKKTDDALFYRDYGDDSQPKSVEKLLLERAKQHMETYREILPSIRN